MQRRGTGHKQTSLLEAQAAEGSLLSEEVGGGELVIWRQLLAGPGV